ncbi:peptidylprolyl isomerase [Candidatus Magnetomorum sp. HK-1]|nr:peptidylprolyl isomerase [Candidatus Magnetomorum sp. HK-1]
MTKVENNLFVSVDYKGTLEDGEIFDTSEGRQPLEVKMGAGQLIKGFEDQLMGMNMNEKKTFTLEPKDAYGERDDSLTRSFAKSQLPEEMTPEVGQVIGLQAPEGQQIPATIIEVDDENFTVDINHPLAGKQLTFDIEVVGISDTATQAPPSACASGCDCSSGNCC